MPVQALTDLVAEHIHGAARVGLAFHQGEEVGPSALEERMGEVAGVLVSPASVTGGA